MYYTRGRYLSSIKNVTLNYDMIIAVHDYDDHDQCVSRRWIEKISHVCT